MSVRGRTAGEQPFRPLALRRYKLRRLQPRNIHFYDNRPLIVHFRILFQTRRNRRRGEETLCQRKHCEKRIAYIMLGSKRHHIRGKR